VLSSGVGDGAAGDVNPIGTIRVMVVLCQATDRVPTNLAAVRTALTNAWNNVHTFYDQASFTRTNVQFDVAANAAALDGVFTDFVDLSASVQNIKGAQLGRIAAFAAQQAQNEGFVLNNYQMLCSVMFTNGSFIRAWGGTDTQTFSYDNGKPVGDPARIHMPPLCGSRLPGLDPARKQVEDCGMDRSGELQAGGRSLGPAHPAAERLQPREAGDHVLPRIAFLDQHDAATAGRDVDQWDLEIEAADAAHDDLRAVEAAPGRLAPVEGHRFI